MRVCVSYQGSHDYSVSIGQDANLLGLFKHIFEYVVWAINDDVFYVRRFDLLHHFPTQDSTPSYTINPRSSWETFSTTVSVADLSSPI